MSIWFAHGHKVIHSVNDELKNTYNDKHVKIIKSYKVRIALQNQAQLQLETIGNIHKDSWNCTSKPSTVTTTEK